MAYENMVLFLSCFSEIKNHPVLVNELNESSLETLLPEEQVQKLEERYLTNEAVRVYLFFTQSAVLTWR